MKPLRPISDIITDLAAGDELSEDAREAVRTGQDARHRPHRPHRHCPCGECMRAYLRAVARGRQA